MAHLPDLGPRLCRARLIPRAWAGFPAGNHASATTELGEATLTSSMLVSLFIPCFVDQMAPRVGLAIVPRTLLATVPPAGFGSLTTAGNWVTFPIAIGVEPVTVKPPACTTKPGTTR